MSSRQWVLYLGCLTVLLATSCSDEAPDSGGDWSNVCIDADGDGYGLQCPAGNDCDDSDRNVHVGCAVCAKPAEGCGCDAGTAAIDCIETPEVTSTGSLLCKEGTRYCRDGKWSACEGLSSFTAPSYKQVTQGLKLHALLQSDAGTCGPCAPDCYEIEDPITATGGGMDGGVSEGGTAWTGSGSITIGGSIADAGVPNTDELTPIPPCNMVTDKDCDGIPDALDPFPQDKPFESDHQTIFMDLAPGQSKSNTFDLRFYLKTADIYFLLDMTGSMDDEKNNLITSLKTGNYLDDPSTPLKNEADAVECADTDFDGVPNSELKSRGVTGNIACLIRSAGFGTGFYREIPYNSVDSNGLNYAGSPDLEPYEHRQDIVADTTAVDKVAASLDTFVTRGNKNWAEAGGVALDAVATGGPIYMGWDRPGIPPRVCTTAGRFGYPCFRSDAMPIVVLVTDAPLMNGPTPAQGHLGNSNINNVNQPVNYEAKGLAYTNHSSDSKYWPVSGNDTFATAYTLNDVHTTFKTYTGDTRTLNADVWTSNLGMTCSSWPSTTATSASYPDAVFKFNVTDASKKVTISTRGTRFKPVIAVYPTGSASYTVSSGSPNHSPATAQDLGQLPSNGMVTLNGDTTSGSYDTGDVTASMVSECARGRDTNERAPDAFYKFTVPVDMNNVRFTMSASYSPIMALWAGSPTITQTTLTSRTNDKFYQDASALTGTGAMPGAIDGTSHWFNTGSTSKTGMNADYAASLFSASGGSCSGVNGSSKDAVIDFTVMGPGSKTIRLESTSASAANLAPSFDNVIALFDRPSAANGTLGNSITCNRNAWGSNRSGIERTLAPGNYSAIIRGQGSDSGSYGLLVSDVAARPVGCTWSADNTSFTANLKAGVTYYLATRGQKVGRGAYTITIGDGSSACAYDNSTYSAKSDPYEPSYDMGTAELVDLSLPVGEYYIVLKGKADISTQASGNNGRGWYQLTIGDRSLAVNNQTAVMPQWGTSTSGIQKDLLDKGIRVITVASVKACTGCSGGAANANLALQQQADLVSSSTKAISGTQTTRDFDIFNNGSGLGYSIVNAIAKLTNNVAMDVSVRFVPLPETPSKPFIFTARAIDVAGDSCQAPVDTNGDNIPDTHKQCTPGAVPRFQITLKNPAAPNNVPPNPAVGSNGGYNMRIEMIADGKYVIDSTPLFVIPEAVANADPPVYMYNSYGTYVQDIAAQCSGTDRPNWQYLQWDDSLPAGTSLVWRACAGESIAELDTCQNAGKWNTVATVTTRDSACTPSSPCTNGYCAVSQCHFPVGSPMSCTTASDCGTSAECISNVCNWTANPISMVPALQPAQNGKRMLRLQVQLNSSADKLRAPTVHNFKVKYTCAPGV